METNDKPQQMMGRHSSITGPWDSVWTDQVIFGDINNDDNDGRSTYYIVDSDFFKKMNKLIEEVAELKQSLEILKNEKNERDKHKDTRAPLWI